MGMIFIYYCIFACATSLTTLFHYYLPALRQARYEGIDNSITQYPVVGSITYVIVTAVMAPFVISTLIFPSHGERFRQGLYRAICKPDE